jgi:hypothetical protein
MPMNSKDGRAINARLVEAEQTIEALKKLRDGHITFPESVLRAIDSAILESEKRLAPLKNAIVG